MGNLLTYSGIVAKVHGMQSKLLTQEEFEEISEMHTVTDAVNYLKEKPGYRDQLYDVDMNKMHRGDVEKLLVQSLYKDYAGLYAFAGMNLKKFMLLYMKRYEAELINYCFRIVFNHYEEPFDLSYKKPFFDRYSKISIDRLIASENLNELIDALKGTEYYKPLDLLRQSGAHTLYDFDLTLTIYYYSAVWRARKKVLKGRELELFTRSVGYKIDLLNIEWIYRAKKYYNMAPAEIYSILIPVQYKLSVEVMKNLVETATMEEFLAQVQNISYARGYDFEQNRTLEKLMKDRLLQLFISDRRRDPYSIATINTYLFVKEEEIDKLTTALECIRYKLPAADVLDHIGGVVR